MKFGKEFEEELVPEWRAKYFDYRQAKKKIKAVDRALRNATRSSSKPFRSPQLSQRPGYNRPVFNLLQQQQTQAAGGQGDENVAPDDAGSHTAGSPIQIPKRRTTEHSPLSPRAATGRKKSPGMTRYGSIIGSPPERGDALQKVNTAPSLKLPGPAVSSKDHLPANGVQNSGAGSPSQPQRSASVASAGPGISLVNSKQRSTFSGRSGPMLQTRVNSMPGPSLAGRKPSLGSRVLSFRLGRAGRTASADEMALEAYPEVDAHKDEFFQFLDSELKKIDDFYREKEEKATERLKALKDQLHIMRDRRMSEVMRAEMYKDPSHPAQPPGEDQAEASGSGTESGSSDNNAQAKTDLDSANDDDPTPPDSQPPNGHDASGSRGSQWTSTDWMGNFDKVVDRAKVGHVGKTFEAMKSLGTPTGPSAVDLHKDYTRKPTPKNVPYRTAKHKLKIALAEYYRGLELLKSYALLNRTAFRKINKKFDKTIESSTPGRYMTDKVANAYFVTSVVVEGHIHAVEDLYSRYFEKGNHKIAVGKLRAKIGRAGEFSQPSFLNGILMALGAVFAVEALTKAKAHLSSGNSTLALHTTYLLQLYGGYFLITLLGLLFCLACRTWHRNKVNYTFVFEFDTRRHILDWRELTLIPCTFLFTLGLVAWLNFHQAGGPGMYLYWPIVLIGTTIVLLFLPLPIFYPRSRQWFLYSTWRLLFAGVYPVEFRDFFLGDLFCSQTYALGTLEIFFCLYAQRPVFDTPATCSSSYSRLLGFLTCLPGIWRALQCLRRFHDTRNAFPHLVNCGKYMFTILYYMSLSLYRMDHAVSFKAFFIVCAGLNALYCSVWDLGMDWSLLDPTANHKFLRKTLAFKSTWPYYAAMVIDPIIRFNWILYAIYTEQPAHASLVAFFVGLSEVMRRGMWMIFRVENEHCANVGHFRAYRDAPLPYESPTTPPGHVGPPEAAADLHLPDAAVTLESGKAKRRLLPDGSKMSGAQYLQRAAMAAHEPQIRGGRHSAAPSPVMRAITRAGTMMHSAHTQDFQRRKVDERKGVHSDSTHSHAMDSDNTDDSEDEEADMRRVDAINRAGGERL